MMKSSENISRILIFLAVICYVINKIALYLSFWEKSIFNALVNIIAFILGVIALFLLSLDSWLMIDSRKILSLILFYGAILQGLYVIFIEIKFILAAINYA